MKKVLNETKCSEHYCDECKMTLHLSSPKQNFIMGLIFIGIFISFISLLTWIDSWSWDTPYCKEEKVVEEVSGVRVMKYYPVDCDKLK